MEFMCSQTEAVYHKNEKIEFHSKDRSLKHELQLKKKCTAQMRDSPIVIKAGYIQSIGR